MTKDLSKYRMIFDYHTHTVYSHGKGSIEDNVIAAKKAGLKGIAISDHGPGHLFYGIAKDAAPKMRRDIDGLKPMHPELEIFLSVEANILDSENGLDISKRDAREYDFLIAGYHYGVRRGHCVANYLKAHSPGWRDNNSERDDSRLCRINTDMALKALYENDIKILTHPGDKGPFDIAELAEACEERGTWMEVSTWHSHLTIDEIKIAAKRDVLFVISSDAHTPERVGSFLPGLEHVISAGVEPERVVNICSI